MQPKEVIRALELKGTQLDEALETLVAAYEAEGRPVPQSILGYVANKQAVEAPAPAEATVRPHESVEALKDSTREQLRTSLKGTNAAIEQLNKLRAESEQLAPVSEADLETAVEAALAQWDEDGSLERAAAKVEALGGRMTLVATANVKVTRQEIEALEEKFGEGQPHTSYVDEELLGLYSDEELSGPVTGDAPVRIRLIHSEFDPELYGKVERQRAALAASRAVVSSQTVPSLFDSVTHKYTLRAGGDQLNDVPAFEKTYIRHFDLPEKELGGFLDVPRSYVDRRGESVLDRSRAKVDRGGRFALG